MSARLTRRRMRPYKRICTQNQATINRCAPTPVRSPRSAIAWRCAKRAGTSRNFRSEEHTSELQSLTNLVCRLLLEKKKINQNYITRHNIPYDQQRSVQ